MEEQIKKKFDIEFKEYLEKEDYRLNALLKLINAFENSYVEKSLKNEDIENSDKKVNNYKL